MKKEQIERRKKIIDLYNFLIDNGYTYGMFLNEVMDLYGFTSQRELGEVVGISHCMISMYRNEFRKITRKSTYLIHLEKLDRVLNFELDDIKEYLE